MTALHSAQTPHPAAASAPWSAPGPGAPRSGRGVGWIVAGAVVLLSAIVLLITGVVVRVVDDSWRRDGYLTSSRIALDSPSRAIATERLDLQDVAPLWPDIDRLLGDVRLRATGRAGSAIFIGVAPADRAAAYLDGVEHATPTELADPVTSYAEHPGGAPAGPPADQDFWLAKATGTGTRAVEWPLADGAWTVVVMNADGSAGVNATVDVGATVSIQDRAATALLVGGGIAGPAGVALIVVGIRRRHPSAHPSR